MSYVNTISDGSILPVIIMYRQRSPNPTIVLDVVCCVRIEHEGMMNTFKADLFE